MQLSHTGSEEMLGKIKKSWGKLREVMGQFLHLIQEDAIGFIDHRSRFHYFEAFLLVSSMTKKLKRRKLEIAVIHVCAKYALSLKIQ